VKFRRKIVALAKLEKTWPERVIQSESFRYRDTEIVRFRSETVYGWRLECGHVIDGQRGHGKRSKDCHYCEWAADGEARHVEWSTHNLSEGWVDLTPAETATRLAAKSG
jgi:hypothetical protein